MNDKVQTSQSVYMDEQVEILVNDDHLGWTDVVDGNWTFSPPVLSVGTYKLTAAFRGKTSAVWNVVVSPPVVDVDDLESAPIGNITEPLVRPFYTLTSAPVGSWTHMPVRVLSSGAPPGKTLYLHCSIYEQTAPEAIMEMNLNRLYLIVSFRCRIVPDIGSGAVKVDAFDAQGIPVCSVDFVKPPGAVPFEVILAAPAGATIKSLRVHQKVGTFNTASWIVDEFEFTR
jgi:hypothetical protein